ncbi:7398_t:CDS:1, partial [Ambispora leptoticha]
NFPKKRPLSNIEIQQLRKSKEELKYKLENNRQNRQITTEVIKRGKARIWIDEEKRTLTKEVTYPEEIQQNIVITLTEEETACLILYSYILEDY